MDTVSTLMRHEEDTAGGLMTTEIITFPATITVADAFARLREAASRLVTTTDNVTDVALDCGFGDISNFNRAFRREFGVSPRSYRRTVE